MNSSVYGPQQREVVDRRAERLSARTPRNAGLERQALRPLVVDRARRRRRALPTDDDHSFDITTASRPSSTAAITPMAEMMPVTGTWPLRNPSSARPQHLVVDGPLGPHDGQAGRRRPAARWRRSGRPGGTRRTGRRRPAGARSSTVTIESMPPPNGTSGAAGFGSVRTGAPTPGPRRRSGRLDAQVGEVEAVAVGELAEPVEVDVAQEVALGGAAAASPAARPPAVPPSCSTTRRRAGTPSGRRRRPPGRPTGRCRPAWPGNVTTSAKARPSSEYRHVNRPAAGSRS